MPTRPADAGTADTGAHRNKRRSHRRPAKRLIDLTSDELAAREAKQRKQRLWVQVTAAEKAEIKARAEKTGNRMSDFVRMVSLSDLKAPAPDRAAEEAERSVAFQLAKMGTNINQIAHIAHETRMLPELAELRELAALIKATLARLHRL
jgi:hypothetical protein